ncbi:hypothetical protein B0J14DRAFT_173072 [Halenospora varia]|nr:hypothetical protein B0J14DRAFT_173072 [Halenospora varia]
MVAGLLWYGWSAENKLSWLMPNIRIGLYTAGSLFCYQCMQVYLVDTYSATAATAFLHSLCLSSFLLFAPFIVEALVNGFEGTLLSGIAIVLGCPTPFVLWKYGERIRKKSPFCAGDEVEK